MNASVEPTAIALPAPGSAKSSYFLFSEDLGNEDIWPFVGRILAAAGQPVGDNVAADLSSEGYAFGPIRNVTQVPIEFDDLGRMTFIFVRDPRDAIAARWISHEPKDIVQFVRIQSIAALVQRYRQIANFCRQRRHVRIVRLEDVRWGWHRLAYELVEALNLDLPLDAAYEIAKDTDIVGPAAGNKLPGMLRRPCPGHPGGDFGRHTGVLRLRSSAGALPDLREEHRRIPARRVRAAFGRQGGACHRGEPGPPSRGARVRFRAAGARGAPHSALQTVGTRSGAVFASEAQGVVRGVGAGAALFHRCRRRLSCRRGPACHRREDLGGLRLLVHVRERPAQR